MGSVDFRANGGSTDDSRARRLWQEDGRPAGVTQQGVSDGGGGGGRLDGCRAGPILRVVS